MHKKSGVVWRKRMRLLARDLKPVTLMKVNGDLYHGIRVNLQSSVNKLLTQAFDIPFEEGDFIERELKNGIKEKYIILKINYSTNVINMDIEKVTDLTKNRGEKIMEERERIVNNTNNFYGEATGIQIQQGTNNSLQEQTITQEFNYAKVKEVLEQIKKYDSMFDEEYGEKAPELRNMIEEIEVLLQKRENPSKIKMVLSADISDLVSKMPIPTSISELQDVYNSSEGTVCLSVNGTLTEWFNSNMDFIPTKYQFFSTKSELYRIMSTVRNKILDWALLLEENGIVGEGMTFTDIEKKIAHNTQVINNYINNFYAEVSDIDMQQGQ